MRVRRLVLGPLETNCFLVDDAAGGDVLVIDPAAELGEITSQLAGATVAAIVLTHGHGDHLAAAEELRAETGALLVMHSADVEAAADPSANLSVFVGAPVSVATPERVLAGGDEVAAGGLRLRVIHTPGHTPGGICLLGGGHLFSGDTLFAGSVGRTDLPGGDGRVLARSLSALAALPDDTVVHPGHGPDTTIGAERRRNPFWPRGAAR
jgi:glyoxylase-like metal-dependent hydrolase (beta-lactamase superfamily II)